MFFTKISFETCIFDYQVKCQLMFITSNFGHKIIRFTCSLALQELVIIHTKCHQIFKFCNQL